MAIMHAVIFDFGGVLVDWDAWALYKTVFKNREEFESFLSESRFFDCLDRSDRGESFDALIEEMKAYAPHCAEHAGLFSKRFMESIVGLQEGTARLVAELKALGVPLYGLTNWSAQTFSQTKSAFSVFDHFDDIIVSGIEGLAKPDPRIFELAIRRWNLIPQKTLFIDDRAENVEAARALGLRGIPYKDSETLRAELEAHFPALERGKKICMTI